MRTISLALALAVLAPGTALAKTLTLGAGTPIASITLPDTWDAETADGGLEALSPDKAIYFSGEAVAAEDLKDAGHDVAQILAEQKITLKQDTRKVAPIKVGGMPGAAIAWDATDENGATTVHLVTLKANADHEVVLLRWGTAAAESANAAAIDAIVKSVTPAK